MSETKCSALTVSDVQCMNTFLAVCRHCNADFCIQHLQEHYEGWDKARLQCQLLIGEIMEKRSQLKSLEPPSEYETHRRSLHQQLDLWIVKIQQLIDTNSDKWSQQKARLITEMNDMLVAHENKQIDDVYLSLLRKQLSHLNQFIERLTQVPALLPTLMQMINEIQNHELVQNNGSQSQINSHFYFVL